MNSAFAPLVPDLNLVHEAVVKVADRLEAKFKVTISRCSVVEDNSGLQEFEEVLKEANLSDSLELLSVAVEEGKLGEAVQEGEEGKEVISKMEQSYAASMQQVSRVVLYLYCFMLKVREFMWFHIYLTLVSR